MRRIFKSCLDARHARRPYYVELFTEEEWERFFLDTRADEREDLCPVHPARVSEFFGSRNTFEIEWKQKDGLRGLRGAIERAVHSKAQSNHAGTGQRVRVNCDAEGIRQLYSDSTTSVQDAHSAAVHETATSH